MVPVRSRLLSIAAAVLSAACVLLLLAVLVFRATLYWHLPVAPGEPYGIADLLEFLLGLCLLFFAALAIGLGVILILDRRLGLRRHGVLLLIVGIASAAAAMLLHPLVAKLSAQWWSVV